MSNLEIIHFKDTCSFCKKERATKLCDVITGRSISAPHDRYILHNGTKYQVNMERPKSSKKQVLELTLHNPYSTKQFDTTEKLKNYVREQALEV